MEELERRLLRLFDELEREAIDLHTFFDLVSGNTPAQQKPVLSAVDRLVERGWLAARGGDFYARTERGRRALSAEN